MGIVVAAVGRLRNAVIRSLLDDYAKRVGRYTKFEEREVRDDAALLKQLAVNRGKARLVALDVQGQALTSSRFSQSLQGWLSSGKGDVVFFIGGAEGLPSPVVDAVDEKLSLSSMTLPHKLARLLLFEQLYRGLSLARGEPYARED